MNDQESSPVLGLLLIGLVLLLGNGQSCQPNSPGPNQPATLKATAATYVYEKSQTAIPSPVLAALNRLNVDRSAESFVASVFEQDTTDGDEQIPDQYKVPLAAAKETGLPALVVTAGQLVLKVVKNPQTEADVIGAIP